MTCEHAQKNTYELVVVGSGPGGLTAAIAGAKAGLNTALIEKNAFVGGNMQIGLNIHGFEDMNGKRVIGGNSWELIQRCIRAGGSVGPVPLQGAHMYSTTPVDLGILQACALDMLEEAGVDIWLHTYAVEPVVTNETVTELVTWSKSGKIAFSADSYIDATGDADIAYRAGAPTVTGRERDGSMQPMSLGMTMAPVNLDEVMEELGLGYGKAVKPHCQKEDYIWFAMNFKAWKEEISHIGIELGKEGVCWGNSIHPEIANLNAVKVIGKSGIDTQALSAAEVQSRKAAIKFGEFLRAKIPGFSKAYIVRIASYIGIRETRRIVGEYVLTKEEALNGTIAEDTIALCGYPIDIHDPTDGIAEFTNIGNGRFGIPYRALLPQKLTNLLVSGRAISSTHEVLGATRVMGTCLAIGEACGTAAVIAQKRHANVSDLNGREVRKLLESQGTMVF